MRTAIANGLEHVGGALFSLAGRLFDVAQRLSPHASNGHLSPEAGDRILRNVLERIGQEPIRPGFPPNSTAGTRPA